MQLNQNESISEKKEKNTFLSNNLSMTKNESIISIGCFIHLNFVAAIFHLNFICHNSLINSTDFAFCHSFKQIPIYRQYILGN